MGAKRPAATFALALLAALVPGEARGQGSRSSPVVEVVRKARDGVVAVKATKREEGEGTRDVVGTGIVVDELGYVATSQHIIASASGIHVYRRDGTGVPAQVVAEDSDHDLAVLKCPAADRWQALPLGPGGDLLVGETVVAIGHPFGFDYTVSTGIVSALGRDIVLPSGTTLRGLMQTDAGINPGNSGGPLLNVNGDVIGVVVAMREGAQGIAFAVNADTLADWLSRRLSAARVAAVSHGLVCSERVLKPEGAVRQQVVVTAVQERTPAAGADVRSGDQVLQVAGRPVYNRFDVERAFWRSKPGQRMELVVLRAGQRLTRTIRLAPAVSSSAREAAPPATRPVLPAAGNHTDPPR